MARHIIIVCSTDGRLRVFINEKPPESGSGRGKVGQINEEDEFIIDGTIDYDQNYEGIEEVPYEDSDEDIIDFD